MPQFDYKARQPDGTTTTGTIESADRRQATQRLREQKLSPITLKEARTAKRSAFGTLREKAKSLTASKRQSAAADLNVQPSKGTPKREKVGLAFLSRLLELHASGLPIGDAIRILSQRLSDSEQKQLASSIWRDLSEGATLAGALTRQSLYFSG